MNPSVDPDEDVELERFGELVPMAELTRWFGQSAGAIPARLRVSGVETTEIGDQEFIQLAVLDAALGLQSQRAIAGQVQATAHREWLTAGAGGRRRTVRQVQDAVGEGPAARREAIAGR